MKDNVKNSPKLDKKQQREQRLAMQLRANLLKRKVQSRQRAMLVELSNEDKSNNKIYNYIRLKGKKI